MPVKIRDIALLSPVILAPMSGITDLPFRRIVKKFGGGLVVSEMVASTAMIRETRQSKQKCAIDKSDPTAACVQLAGCEPGVMAEAAALTVELGAQIIDMNFGCPMKKVVNGYAGSALMRDEQLAEEIIKAVVRGVNVPVTLKMRMGWDFNSLNAPRLAQIAEDNGVQMITVHGRTRSQFFTGQADWGFVKQVKDVVTIPVIVNGDIKTPEQAQEALRCSNADGVMIGRGVYGKPWLLSEIAYFLEHGKHKQKVELRTRRETMSEHYEAGLEYYGVDVGVRLMRAHLSHYAYGLPGSGDFRRTINALTNPEDVRELIANYFAKIATAE